MSVQTITVGRVGLDIPLRVPAEGAWSAGDDMKISGTLGAEAGYSLEQSVALFHQFNGLVNADERVVPCTFAATPSLDGFWEVGAASVKTDGASWATGAFDYDLTLHRVRGSSQPIVDVRTLRVYRTGYAVTEANSQALYPFPLAVTFYNEVNSGFGGGGGPTRTADTGGVFTLYRTGAGLVSLLTYQIAPSDWYDGACKVQVTFDGSTWFTLTGRQIPAGITSWRLNNGLVKVTPSATAGRIDVSHYDGTTWETAKIYRMSVAGASNVIDLLRTVVILRNGPHIVGVRLGATYGGAYGSSHLIDLTLRRGDRLLCGRMTASNGGGVRRETAEAATAATGGLAATANDASGNRYVLASVLGTTKDAVNGGLSSGSGTTFDFGIGSAIGGSGAASGDTTTDVLAQYGSWVAENPRVVIP